jgi:hypothetical protein
MLKTSMIVASLLALSGSAAIAQSYAPWIPAGPNAAPGGAGGPAPATSIGSPSPNATDTVGGGTRSTTILSQSNKAQSAAGASRSDYDSQAQLQYGALGLAAGAQDNPRRVAITDEYGNQYNRRGERIGHSPAMR